MEISGNILLFQVSWSEVVIMRREYRGTGTKEVIRKVTARKQYREQIQTSKAKSIVAGR